MIPTASNISCPHHHQPTNQHSQLKMHRFIYPKSRALRVNRASSSNVHTFVRKLIYIFAGVSGSVRLFTTALYHHHHLLVAVANIVVLYTYVISCIFEGVSDSASLLAIALYHHHYYYEELSYSGVYACVRELMYIRRRFGFPQPSRDSPTPTPPSLLLKLKKNSPRQTGMYVAACLHKVTPTHHGKPSTDELSQGTCVVAFMLEFQRG